MSVLLTRSVWLLYLGVVQRCSYLFPKRHSTSVQVMEAHFKTAYTKHFFFRVGGCERISQHPLYCFLLSNFTFIFSQFLSFLESFLNYFIPQGHPSFYFLLHCYDNFYSLYQLSLKGPVAVSVIIFLVRLRADGVSLLPFLFHNLDCPFVFTLMK